MRLVRGALVLLVACVATFSSLTPVQAQQASPGPTDPSAAGLSGDEEARMRFELGRRYYDTGRFVEAAREFAEAHRLSGRTELLYNLFLAYRDAGDDQHAIETLRAYIPSLEAGERRTQLEARLRVLEQRLAAPAGTGGGDATTGGASEGGAEGEGTGTQGGDGGAGGGTGTSGDGSSGGSSDGSGGGLGILPWIVVGAGGALVVASVITGVLALDARSSLTSMCSADGACPPGYESTQSSGQALAITTDVLWITGALAVGTGVVLAILDMTSGGSSDQASIGGVCTGEGCLASISGRF